MRTNEDHGMFPVIICGSAKFGKGKPEISPIQGPSNMTLA
jgi:hypothetical protein